MPDIDLANLARTAVADVIGDLAHDRMGIGERLDDYVDFAKLDTAEQDALCKRLEDEIRKLHDKVQGADAEERAHSQTIAERDSAEEWADKLAAATADLAGVDIGEHSNLNNPWANALEELRRAAAEVERLRYERRLLGAARRILDLVATGEPERWDKMRAEAEDVAQRIVDEIGHPVTDEPALGPRYRETIADQAAEVDRLTSETTRQAAEIAKLRVLLDRAQDYIRDLQDGGTCGGESCDSCDPVVCCDGDTLWLSCGGSDDPWPAIGSVEAGDRWSDMVAAVTAHRCGGSR